MTRIVTYRYKRPPRKRKPVAIEGPAVVAIIQLCLSPIPAAAELSLVLSNGQITCGEFLADNERTQNADIEWVLGYISGRNQEAPAGSQMAGASFTTVEPVKVWLQNYCRNHPFNLLVTAADELRAEFLRRERSPAPKPQ